MSAFERLPLPYRLRCIEAGRIMGAINNLGQPKRISPQNRRVRFAVDLEFAREAELPPHRVTRQQRRQVARLGPAYREAGRQYQPQQPDELPDA